jgi:hypothetical protein
MGSQAAVLFAHSAALRAFLEARQPGSTAIPQAAKIKSRIKIQKRHGADLAWIEGVEAGGMRFANDARRYRSLFLSDNLSLITEPVAKLQTARNWRRFQRCEQARRRCIRWAVLLLLSLGYLCFLLFK